MIPLSEPTFLILLSLAPGPRHGYAILQDVAALSEGRVKLSTGTLYTALKRLLDNGWIEPAAEPGPRKRQAYRLSAAGGAALRAEAGRLAALAGAAQQRLGNMP